MLVPHAFSTVVAGSRQVTTTPIPPIWSRILTVKTDPNRGRRSGFQLTSPTNRRGKHLRLDYLALFISDNKMSRKMLSSQQKTPHFSGNNSTGRRNMCVPHAFSTTVAGSRQVTTTTIPHGGMRPGRPAASPNSQRAPARVRASGRPPSRAACGPGGLPRAQTRSGVFRL